MLNFALDTRSTSGKTTKAIYKLTSKFGKLKNSELIDCVELAENLKEFPDLRNKKIFGGISNEESNKLEQIEKQLSTIKNMISTTKNIVIIGHCGEGSTSLSSDTGIEIKAADIKKFFPKDMKNTNIDLVACE